MRFVLIGSHACTDNVHPERGKYHLRVYHDSLTRAVIEEREYHDVIELTATVAEGDRTREATTMWSSRDDHLKRFDARRFAFDEVFRKIGEVYDGH